MELLPHPYSTDALGAEESISRELDAGRPRVGRDIRADGRSHGVRTYYTQQYEREAPLSNQIEPLVHRNRQGQTDVGWLAGGRALILG